MNNQSQIPEFGIKRENEEQRDGGCAIVFDPESQRYAIGKQDDGALRLFSGGVDAGEDIQTGILREVTEESGLDDFLHVEILGEVMAHFYNSLRKVNRVAHTTGLLVVLKSTRLTDVILEEHEKFHLVWVTAEEIMNNWQARNDGHNLDHWIYFFEKAIKRLEELKYKQ